MPSKELLTRRNTFIWTGFSTNHQGFIAKHRRSFFVVAQCFGLETLIAPQLSIAQASCSNQPNGSKQQPTEKPSEEVVPFFLGNCSSKKAAWQPSKQEQKEENQLISVQLFPA